MHNILFTGGSGFIGSNILNNIQHKNKIYLIQRKESKKIVLKFKNIKIIKFKNYKILASKLKKLKINTVIHCATHYKKNHNQDDIEKFAKSNILLGNIILENIKNMKVKKFINFTTTWENEDGILSNPKNLYAAYKNGFNCLLQFYKKIYPSTKFIDLILVDTFGYNDKRKKIINTLKSNYRKNKITKIISKNLNLNLINVEDIVSAVDIILKKNIKSGRYILKNSKFINIFNLIKYINKNSHKKIKIKWLSNIKIKDKFLKYKKLKSWKPKKSNISNIKNLILNN